MALNDKLINYGNLAEFHSQILNDTGTTTGSTWSSDKINTELSGKQATLVAGSGITISGNTISATGGGGSVDMMVEVTYAELKALRDNSQLVPGQQYRITDYVTTTAQANTQSAGHQFDIIVVADSEDKLNENARAIQHSDDTYFANCKLESWELKYCLDNDTNRFSWAQVEREGFAALMLYCEDFSMDSVFKRYPEGDANGQYAWAMSLDGGASDGIEYVEDWDNIETSVLAFSNTESLEIGDIVTVNNGGDTASAKIEEFNPNVDGIPAGKGVIYYMKDEWNNECPYDFKNVLFKKYINNDDWIYCYTFSFYYDDSDNKIIDVTLFENRETVIMNKIFNNIIKPYVNYSDGKYIYILNGIIFLIRETTPITLYKKGCYCNTFNENCHDILLGSFCWDNIFGKGCKSSDFAINYDNLLCNIIALNNFAANGGIVPTGITNQNNTHYIGYKNSVFTVKNLLD